jgi:hypothetical protein
MVIWVCTDISGEWNEKLLTREYSSVAIEELFLGDLLVWYDIYDNIMIYDMMIFDNMTNSTVPTFRP